METNNNAYIDLETQWTSRRQRRIFISLLFAAIGFSAIIALALALVGLLALDIGAIVLVWPAVIAWMIVGLLYPRYGKLALKGFLIGIVACLLYDCLRFLAIALDLWSDFIPKIGMLLLHNNKPNWVIGYLWRYIGDGGFMSVAFVMFYRLNEPKINVVYAAVIFALLIWISLLMVIVVTPPGMLFTLTPCTFLLSFIGHLIYGGSIGMLYRRYI